MMFEDRRICFFSSVLSAQRLFMMLMLNLDHGGSGTGSGSSASMSRRCRLRARRRRHRRDLLSYCSRFTFALMILNAGVMTNHPRIRRSIDRPGEWWGHAQTTFSNRQWKENFRISRGTFDFLVEELREEIEKTNRGGTIGVEKRLAITIWRLATPNAYRCISQLFGVGRSTACTITHDVSRAIVRVLLPRYIKFPEGEVLEEVKMGFEAMGMPGAVGAIDGTHIPIKAPKENPHDYYNRKGFHSLIMQAVVDHKCRFTDIYLGWPGCVHDARVLHNSSLYHKAEHGTLLPEERQLIAGVQVPLYILGDAAYPLRSWLMKGYPETGRLTQRQINFNYQLSRVRMVVERTFGLLKSRWRSLSRVNESKVENMSHLIAASCVLHNICQNSNYEGDEDIQEPIVQPLQQPNLGANATPVQCRDALAQYLHP